MTVNVETEGVVGRDSVCLSEEGLSQSEAQDGSDMSRTVSTGVSLRLWGIVTQNHSKISIFDLYIIAVNVMLSMMCFFRVVHCRCLCSLLFHFCRCINIYSNWLGEQLCTLSSNLQYIFPVQ